MATVIPEQEARRKAESFLLSIGEDLCTPSRWEQLRDIFDWSPEVGRDLVEKLARNDQLSFELAMKACKDDPGASSIMLRAMARWSSALHRTPYDADKELEEYQRIEFIGAAWHFCFDNPPLEAAIREEILGSRSLALHLLRRKDPEAAVELSLKALEELKASKSDPTRKELHDELQMNSSNILLNLILLPEFAGEIDEDLYTLFSDGDDEEEIQLIKELAEFMRNFSEKELMKRILKAEDRINDTLSCVFIWAVLEVACPHLLVDAALIFTHKLILSSIDPIPDLMGFRFLLHVESDFPDLAACFSIFPVISQKLHISTVRHVDLSLIHGYLANERDMLLMGIDRSAEDTLRCLKACLDDHDNIPTLAFYARAESEMTRITALSMMYHVDDPRCASELLAAFRDPSPAVQEFVEDMLLHTRSSPAFMDGWPQPRRIRWVADKLDAINRIYAWGYRTGFKLTGRGTIITQYQTGVGRTHAKASGPMEIEVSDLPIVSGHPHGESIVRGILLHEIGHHVFDIGVRGTRSARGRARSAGAGELYDVLLDERMERLLRGKRDEYGHHLDRTLAYVFSENQQHAVPLKNLAEAVGQDPESLRRKFQSGEIGGRLEGDHVSMSPCEQLLFTGVIHKKFAFYLALRAGYTVSRLPWDEDGRRALALITPAFKRMSHQQMATLAIRIKDILGIDDCNDKKAAGLLKALRRLLPTLNQALKHLNEVGGHLPKAFEDGTIDRKGALRRNSTALPTSRARPTGNRSDWTPPKRKSTFTPMESVEKLEPDQAAQQNELRLVRQYVRPLRAFMERTGSRIMEDREVRTGHRVDPQGLRRSMINPGAGMFINREIVRDPNAYVGLLIDRSGSMDGKRIKLARSFGVLLAESMRDLRGITGHIHAFDDNRLYDLGNFQRHAIASLEAGGGNNDCGALHYAARLAQASRMQNRLLIMISDGQPTDGCCPASLCTLVEELESQWGINCVQVAVHAISDPSFRQYVDLSELPYGEAVNRFGRIIEQQARAW